MYKFKITTKAFKSHLWRHDSQKEWWFIFQLLAAIPQDQPISRPSAICSLLWNKSKRERLASFSLRLIGESNSAGHECIVIACVHSFFSLCFCCCYCISFICASFTRVACSLFISMSLFHVTSYQFHSIQ